jgi:hypothetical protein
MVLTKEALVMDFMRAFRKPFCHLTGWMALIQLNLFDG